LQARAAYVQVLHGNFSAHCVLLRTRPTPPTPAAAAATNSAAAALDAPHVTQAAELNAQVAAVPVEPAAAVMEVAVAAPVAVGTQVAVGAPTPGGAAGNPVHSLPVLSVPPAGGMVPEPAGAVPEPAAASTAGGGGGAGPSSLQGQGHEEQAAAVEQADSGGGVERANVAYDVYIVGFCSTQGSSPWLVQAPRHVPYPRCAPELMDGRAYSEQAVSGEMGCFRLPVRLTGFSCLRRAQLFSAVKTTTLRSCRCSSRLWCPHAACN
jgi:hypothetical protein